MGCASSKPNQNLELCRNTFDMQVTMAMGAVSQEMMAEFSSKFAADFAPELEWAINGTDYVGKGDFAAMMAVVYPIWAGFVNTKCVNSSFKPKSQDVIIVEQAYDGFLPDAKGTPIPGTEVTGYKVKQTIRYKDGKINFWGQDWDKEVMNKRRMAEAKAKNPYLEQCKQTFDMQTQMATGAVSETMLAEFNNKFAADFAPELQWAVNDTDYVGKGDFAAMMAVVYPIWAGFVNTKCVNTSFTPMTPDEIIVDQTYDSHLPDADGKPIPGTEVTGFKVRQAIRYKDGKINFWGQDWDKEVMDKRRKAEAKAKNPYQELCKKTFDMQTQMATGAVSEEMLAEFNSKFAADFAPELEWAVNGTDYVGKGDFAAMMAVVYPIWAGFVNTKCVNKSFTPTTPDEIVIEQAYDSYLPDAKGTPIPGTEVTGYKVKQTVRYKDGKINFWGQEWDKEVMHTRRMAEEAATNPNLPLCKKTFEMQTQMAMGAVSENMMAEFSSKFAADFAPEILWIINGTEYIGKGDFSAMMACIFPIWAGFVNTKCVNKSFRLESPDDVIVEQAYDAYLPDADGKPIPGTEASGFEVKQTIHYKDGKIIFWGQEFDAELMAKRRAVAAAAKK